MTTLTRNPVPVNSAPAADWPAWTDRAVYELGPDDEPFHPTAEDDAWWAEQTRDAPPDDDGPSDAEWDRMAEESAWQDRYERGLVF